MKVLLKYCADVHWPLGPSKDKKTPIILAAAHGNMKMVKLLFKQGAFIEQEGMGNEHEIILKEYCKITSKCNDFLIVNSHVK